MASIEFAGYGVWDSTFDVTAKVRDQYGAGQRHFTANNGDYGDPSPGDRKYLYIVWKSGGQVASGVVGENDGKGVNLP
jgi:hypothetical protein